ncbi:hypothetical protein AB0K80_08350 [Streptomyces sp. NPDC052682]|uniref:hypothetical protein n=1 Tax=Streptomyces sp. NPDC052682 TaxID=3154954 RepID=UPI00341D98F4
MTQNSTPRPQAPAAHRVRVYRPRTVRQAPIPGIGIGSLGTVHTVSAGGAR